MQSLFEILGIEFREVSHAERLVSALGAFLGIATVVLTSRYFVSGSESYLVIASMGASAVLLFAVPHGALSQPWALFGGHLVSAIIGVSCSQFIPNDFIAAPLAVGIAVGAMHYLRCIHPPGGATALAAVISGPGVEALGYQFVLTPVMANTAAILFTAVVFNAFFDWRRYPAWLHARFEKREAAQPYEAISHEDFVYALSEIDSFVDVSENDLLRIYDLVTRNRQSRHLDPQALRSLSQVIVDGEYTARLAAWLAGGYFAAGRIDAARDVAQLALQEYPGDAGLAILSALIAHSDGDDERAVTLLRNIPDSDPYHAVASLNRAALLIKMNNPDEARVILNRLIREFPGRALGNRAAGLLAGI